VCLSCSCISEGGSPTDDHGDPRNITVGDLNQAAEAAGVTAEVVAQEIVASLAASEAPEPEDVVVKRLAVPDNPQRFVLGVAYPADCVDGHDEFMSAADVEQTAWDFLTDHRRLGFFHADGTEGHADVCESYIYRGPDWVTQDIDGNEQVIKSGYWMLGARTDPAGFEVIVSEAADGWSMDGLAARRTVRAPVRKSEE